jgi:hypothetical protein
VARRFDNVARLFGDVTVHFGDVARSFDDVTRRFGDVAIGFDDAADEVGDVSKGIGGVYVNAASNGATPVLKCSLTISLCSKE